MKRLLYPVLTSIILSICLSSTAQKKVYPNTLLWRITGNGLTKPSYLFGTMHLNDRRLFHFSDSLYNYLEKAEAFAMEVDADEMMRALIISFSAEDTSGYLKDAIDKEDYQKISGELEAQFGIPASKITKKQAWIYKQSIQSKTKSKAEDMDSFVDAYLFNIAKRQGKWVGGLEDIEDQLDLFQEFDGFSLSNKYFQKKENQLTEKLIKIYIAQDLNSIQDWFDEMEPKEKFRMLTKRNLKMAERIDSMSAAKSCFFAVGAAHLPGNDGLIDLLISKGFTVDPVTSKNKIAPEKYSYKAVDLPWMKVENEVKAYTAFMPGEAVPYQPEGGAIKMHIYGDLGTGKLFYNTC
ncbi:MAG: TraB/GumN family protein [Flavisolibacter sp.]|nr:TraB/GumN family protein [Flavisolibacter sp.]